LAKVDLELAIGHSSPLAAKTQAGFSWAAGSGMHLRLPEDAVRLRPAMADPEIMREIFSL
jgi:hypothetical protein